MIKGGRGGGKTQTGRKFEIRASLEKAIKRRGLYTIEGETIYKGSKAIGKLFRQRRLYGGLLKPAGIDYRDYISKQLIPDNAFLQPRRKKLVIVEYKYQGRIGSVDEKLQTCDFKKKQYEKLLAPLHISVEYVYVLSGWFQRNQVKYRDVFEYIIQKDCYYFFKVEELLSFLRL